MSESLFLPWKWVHIFFFILSFPFLFISLCCIITFLSSLNGLSFEWFAPILLLCFSGGFSLLLTVYHLQVAELCGFFSYCSCLSDSPFYLLCYCEEWFLNSFYSIWGFVDFFPPRHTYSLRFYMSLTYPPPTFFFFLCTEEWWGMRVVCRLCQMTWGLVLFSWDFITYPVREFTLVN